MTLLFLSSGLFLAWSLGANNAANVFGPAVGTRMVPFRTAALITSLMVLVGAVAEGSGATRTLGELGAINTLPGAFTIGMAAAITTALMTRSGLPVSTSQAIVGAIIGWNIFVGVPTNIDSLVKIVSTWVASPILAGVFAMLLYWIFRHVLEKIRIHILMQDALTRFAFIVVGAFGAYSLGANNIANAMGVFAAVSPFHGLQIGAMSLSSTQILFAVGGVAIGVGVFTYSMKVMKTVGADLFRLSPVAGLIVVLAEALVLFLFGSMALKQLLVSNGLPSLPLVPVSSSQAVVGAVLGIAVAKGGRNIQFRVLGRIGLAWLATPVLACVMAWTGLFVMQNVFDQQVHLGKTAAVEQVSTQGNLDDITAESEIVLTTGYGE
ncbi:MAG: inorganic phosphate transporter [Candidatus Cloacimonetes bacterium]|nr:inorganic phosphate transporter [Candidatus Cloacimonadota bacterium]